MHPGFDLRRSTHVPIFVGAFCMTCLTMGSASAQDATVATVNGKPVSRAQVDFIVKEQVRRGNEPSAELLKKARQEAISREALAQEAERKLRGSADLRVRLEFMRKTALINALREDFFLNSKPSEDEIRNAYETAKSTIGETEWLARHILVDSEASAQALIDRIRKGEHFEDPAAAHSLDGSTAGFGGGFGWAAPGNFPTEFSDAVKRLKKGELAAQPVKTSVGWHVIRLDDVRTAKPPTLDEARPRLVEHLIEDRWREYVSQIQGKARVR